MKIITRNILIVSLVSLFTDIASEMLYPIMPMFLKSIGFSVALIGVLEGIAEFTAGIGKGFFGKMSDSMGKRTPFIRGGYFLSAVSKPLMAIFTNPFWILFSRTLDRLGKGLRTGARDALLSDETKPEFKGRVFGFHRAFDTTGAAIGPIFALIYLNYYPANYTKLFLIAFIPGFIAILFSFLIRDKIKAIRNKASLSNAFSFFKYWSDASKEYKKVILALIIFALINSSDLFLLLVVKTQGFDDRIVIGLYILYNIVYALCSQPLGIFGDKFGFSKTLSFGLILFSFAYLLISFTTNFYLLVIIFVIYGIYAAATEGISKAWISNIVPKSETATAIGFFTGSQSIAALLSSVIAGVLWSVINIHAPFILAALVAMVVAIYILTSFKSINMNFKTHTGK